jgi:hypothetical protein
MDSKTNGPEDIYWPMNGTSPPFGVYYACVEVAFFTGTLNSTNPLLAVLTVNRPTDTNLTFTKFVTQTYSFDSICSATANGFMASFTYP